MLVITVALPATAVGASVRSGQSSAPPVKVGMIYAVTSQIGGNADARDAFQAAIKAFNKRGGAGASGAKIEGIICDTRGDPNQEVACARWRWSTKASSPRSTTSRTTTRLAWSRYWKRRASPESASGRPTSPSSRRTCRIPSRPASSPRTSAPRSASKRTAIRRSASFGPTQRRAPRSAGSSRRCSRPSVSRSSVTSSSRPVPPTTRPTSPRSSVRTRRRCSSRTPTRSVPS